MATYYWVGGSGTWDNVTTTNWAASSGGAGGAGVPTNVDTVNFDANSGTAATVTVTSTATCAPCVINKSDINLNFTGSATIGALGNTVTLTAGTITLNSFTLSCGQFSSNNSNTRAINFGTGAISIANNGTTVYQCSTLTGMTYSGSKTVNFIYSGSAGTRSVANGTTAGASEANAINVNVTAGTDGFACGGGSAINNLNLTGWAGSLNNQTTIFYGDVTMSTGGSFAAGANTVTFSGTLLQKITTNGKTWDAPLTFNGVGGTFRFEDNFTQGSTRLMRLTNGTLNGNDKNISIGTFALGAGTKTLTLGSGTWTVAGASWNANTNVTGLTVSASTGTISMTSGSAKTFSGGGLTWPTLNQGGVGNLTINQNNTFANITNTVQPATIRFTAGTTQTVSAFNVSGTSGNLITLDTTVAGTQATLSDLSGVVSVSFCSIKDINATGGAFWQAYTVNGNVDGGNNLGWDFNATAWSYMYNVRKSKRILPGV